MAPLVIGSVLQRQAHAFGAVTLSTDEGGFLRHGEAVAINRRHFALGLGASAAAVAMPGCGDGVDVAEWTEEVLLHDGRIVTVWRKARARSSGFPTASRGGHVDSEIRFEPLGAHWKGTWQRGLAAFDVFHGVPHLVLYIRDRESCRSKPPTDYAAQFLRLEGGNWIDVRQTDFPIDRALLNLSVEYWGRSTDDDYKGLIRWDSKMLPGTRDPMDTVKTYFDKLQLLCSSLNT